MNKLYSELAQVYEAMYATFINYEEEYSFYSEILRKYDRKSLIEIGSGTGKLAEIFQRNDFEYYGLDYSPEMISIAQRRLPNCEFMQGDMRNFTIENPVDGAIMTGRTISYLLTNEDVNNAFKSVYKNLENKGIFIFDFIDANRFIADLLAENSMSHKANYKGIDYVRESVWNIQMKNGMDFIWDSKYSKKTDSEWIELGIDQAEVRAFTKDEIAIFLQINGFELKEIVDRASYFFPTYVIVAEKKIKKR